MDEQIVRFPQPRYFEKGSVVRINCNIFDPERYGCECTRCEFERDNINNSPAAILGPSLRAKYVRDIISMEDKLTLYEELSIYVRPILPWSKYHEVMACTGKTYHLSSDEIDLVSNPESGK